LYSFKASLKLFYLIFSPFSDADNFEPAKPVIPVADIVGGAKLNKWEGEDEEENIKVRQ